MGKIRNNRELEITISNHLWIKSEYAIKLTFQSSVVTSLLFSFVLPLTCFNTNAFKGSSWEPGLLLPPAIVQIRAVESPDLQGEMMIVKWNNIIRSHLSGSCFHNTWWSQTLHEKTIKAFFKTSLRTKEKNQCHLKFYSLSIYYRRKRKQGHVISIHYQKINYHVHLTSHAFRNLLLTKLKAF